jgi:putative transposase
MGGTFTQLFVHLVWSTRARAPLIVDEQERRIYAVIRGRCREAGAAAIAIGGTADHIHVLAEIPTTVSIAELAHSLKGGSAYEANKHAAAPFRIRWQSGYGAFTVSRGNVAAVARYVRNQKTIHASRRTHRALEQTAAPRPSPHAGRRSSPPGPPGP